MWNIQCRLKLKASCHLILEVVGNRGLKPQNATLCFFFWGDEFTQSRRREATNTARLEKKKQTVTLGCALPGGDLVPAPGLEAGAILATTGGKGASVTSDSVKGGSGAWAGGSESVVMIVRRSPGETGSM